LPGGLGGAFGGGGGAGGEGGAGGGATESRRDDWARPQRTEINGVSLRVLIEDESRKLNVLGMLTADDDEAEKAFRRVVRVLDLFREGTADDLSSGQAEAAADALRQHLVRRRDSKLPRSPLLSDDPQELDRGMPLTLAELVVVEPFERDWFRDRRNADGIVVHGLERYLTVWSSMQTQAAMLEARAAEQPGGTVGGSGGTGSGGQGGAAGQGGTGSGGQGGPAGQGGQGAQAGQGAQGSQGGATGVTTPGATAGAGAGQLGGAGGAGGGAGGAAGAGGAWRVNLNTAPPVVLKSLTDDRDVHPRFWDEVITHRNAEDETQNDPDADPILDEYGEPILVRKIFTAAQELETMDGWTRFEPEFQNEILGLVGVSSEVFTVYVTARIDTSPERGGGFFTSRAEQERYEESAGQLVRTVRCVVWRRATDDGQELLPIQRWKVLDWQPYEILDSPDEDR